MPCIVTPTRLPVNSMSGFEVIYSLLIGLGLNDNLTYTFQFMHGNFICILGRIILLQLKINIKMKYI